MAATRVGDSWTFKIPRTQLIYDTPIFIELGSVPPGEDYHGILTARVTWQDPSGAPVQRLIGLNIELMAFDVNGVNLSAWDNDLMIVQDRQYFTDPDARYDQPIISQAVFTVPIDAAVLKLSMTDASTQNIGTVPVVEEAKIVMTIVTPRV